MVVAAGMVVLLLVLLPAGGVRAGSPGEAQLKPVTLILQWMPQSQFAGYYMAKEKGFYAENGLDVTILRGGPDRDQIAYLRDGRADFATLFLTGALIYRDRGVPLVHLTQVVNRSNLMLVARAEREITEVGDLDGRRVSLWGEAFRAAYLGWFHASGVAPLITPQYYSVNLFLRGGVDACAAMYYNEYHVLYQSGVDWDEMVTFFMHEQGFDFPEDGIYCLESTLAADPESCRAFAEASLQGWAYAAAHPEETLQVVMREVRAAHVPTNSTHQEWMLRTILPSIVPTARDDWQLGELSPEDYMRTIVTLQGEFITSPSAAPFDSFHPWGSAR